MKARDVLRAFTDAAWAAFNGHPTLALGITALTASFGYAFVKERARLLALMRDTAADLDARSGEIELRMRRAFAEETDAVTTLTDDEIAERIAG